jgi:tetratricopeptide (TPR) repeat protein
MWFTNRLKIAAARNKLLRRSWLHASILSGCALLAGLTLAGFGKADGPFANAPDGEFEFESAHYKEAIPLLRQAVAEDPAKPVPAAHLLSSLVHEGQLGDADALGAQLEQSFPNSADALAARGDLAFYRGDLGDAQKLWVAALKASPENAWAYFGLYRLYRSASMYFSARNRIMKAHDLDPANVEIARIWFALLTPEKRKELFEQYTRFNQPETGNEELEQEFGEAISRELNGRKVFEPVNPPAEATLKLSRIYEPRMMRGYSMEVRLNGQKPLHLLFDTGASGIMISVRAAEKLGLKLVGATEAWGVGDKGAKAVNGAISDGCSVGPVEYRNCFLRAMEGRSVTDEDGLIGADFFAAYVITIDFQRLTLHLKPQPARVPRPQGYDRTVPEDEKDFSPVFRFGHHLMLTTIANDKVEGLFLIDTGSTASIMDSVYAREAGKVRGDDFTVVKGISGTANKVWKADDATLQFAHFKQHNLGMVVADLNNSGKPARVRLSGIFGLPVLTMFRLTLDYRNGLVKFDYLLK